MNRVRPVISIIIPTRDRAVVLAQCLDALAEVRFDRHTFEVLVVDNGSADATPAVVKRTARQTDLPLRRISEPTPGVARARNAGLVQAVGRFVVFLDDDVHVTPGWLEGYWREFQEARAEAVQGRVQVRFLGPPPAWLGRSLLPALGQTDQGLEAGLWADDVVTLNLGVARRVLDQVGPFDPDLGPPWTPFGEDTEFSQRVAAGGFTVRYAPEALGYHQVSAARLSRSAFLRRAYQAGWCRPLYTHYPESLFRALAGFSGHTLRQILALPFCANEGEWMNRLHQSVSYIGRITQLTQQRVFGRPMPERDALLREKCQ